MITGNSSLQGTADCILCGVPNHIPGEEPHTIHYCELLRSKNWMNWDECTFKLERKLQCHALLLEFYLTQSLSGYVPRPQVNLELFASGDFLSY